jgi:xanthine dehydrogenase FAD-binding subunit
MVETLRPEKLKDALDFLKIYKALPFAGGTDLMVHYRNYSGTESKIDKPLLFTDAIKELRHIKVDNDWMEIGAAVLLSELEVHKDVPLLLKSSITGIAAPALRNRATLAGNICNASPAGDSLPPLYLYEAELVLASSSGKRFVNIREFITGPGKTILKEDELLTAIRIPLLKQDHKYYRKVGTRAANALSKLSVAAFAVVDEGIISDFRLALGAVAPLIVRDKECEDLVIGCARNQINIKEVVKAYGPLIRPIDDQRSTADYRKQVALNIVKDFLEKLRGKI